jgi:threonine aldolase
MRQAGIIAAGALYALEHQRVRLPEDHRAARTIWAALRELPAIVAHEPETNMVLVDLPVAAAEVVAMGRRHGVLLGAVGPGRLRLVTHLDVSGAPLEGAVAALVATLREACDARGAGGPP